MKVAIHLTHDCNMRCSYCYVGKKYEKVMNAKTAEHAVRFVHENSTRRVDISFFGGEPLLEKDLLLHTVDYSDSYRQEKNISIPVRYFVTTNGLLITEDFLKSSKKRKIKVSLSLDGHGKGHDLTRTLPDGSGSFDKISENFPLIQKYYPALDILYTFTPANVEFLAEGIEKLYFCGFRIFMIGPNYEEPWNEESLEKMRLEYHKLSKFYYERFELGEYIYINIFDGKIASHTLANCEICSCCDKEDGEIAVAPSGNLFPCLRFVKGDDDPSLVIGNLNDGINKKLRAKIMLESSKEWKECSGCGYRGRCFHYCSAVNYKVTGKFNHPPPVLCRQEQYSITFADEVASQLYRSRNPQFMKRFYPEKI